MVDIGDVTATDKIVLAGDYSSREREVEDVTNMYPGRLVLKGTTDNEIKVSGDNGLLGTGFLGYEDTPVMYRPTNKDTIYVLADRASVLTGPGMIFRASLAENETVVQGDELVGAAGGKLKKVTYDTSHNVAYRIYAEARESITSAGADEHILVKSRI